MKEWLDKNIVPLLSAPGLLPLQIHSEIHSPPEDFDLVVVYLFAEKGTWPAHVKRLLDQENIYWDFMREFQKAVVHGEAKMLFGGDGSPFLHDNGMVSCRLFTKIGDVGTIMEIGCDHKNKLLAQQDVKDLYKRFEDEGVNFHDVMVNNTPPFGMQQ